MPNPNLRFGNLGALSTEVLAPQIRIFWEPLNDTGTVRFITTKFIHDGTNPVARTEQSGDVPSLDLQLEDHMATIYNGVSGADVMTFLKTLFDEAYNTRAALLPQPE